MNKGGVLYFVPKERITGVADGDPAIEGFKDLKFATPGSHTSTYEPMVIKEMSKIGAELSRYQLDIGKTMGVRRLKLDSWTSQTTGYSVRVDPKGDGGVISITPNYPPYDDTVAQPDDGYAAQAVSQLYFSLQKPTKQTIKRRTKTFTHKQFLLINLNFKGPLAETPKDKVKWKFGSKEDREENGAFKIADLGRVAFQEDKKSWWVLKEIRPVVDEPGIYKPTWDSQDSRSEIVAGCLTDRSVLFFLGDDGDGDGTADPYFPFIDLVHNLFVPPDTRARDLKDQRVLALPPVSGLAEKPYNFGSKDIKAFPIAYKFYYNWPYLDRESGLVRGDLGIFNTKAALAGTTFTEDDIGKMAVRLEIGEDNVQRWQALVLLSLTPNHGDPVDWNYVANGGIDRLGPKKFVSRVPFIFYQYRDNPAVHDPFLGDLDYSYGSTRNPVKHGAWIVEKQEGQGAIYSTQFFNTDEDP